MVNRTSNVDNLLLPDSMYTDHLCDRELQSAERKFMYMVISVSNMGIIATYI